jgi:predicted enzyme related to lactoylglutathione lyase
MKLKIQNLSTVRIFSSDVLKSREFYKQLFDLDPIEDLENFVSFKIGKHCLDIVSADAKNPFSQGGSISYWLIDNMSSILEKIDDLGGKVYRGPLNVPEIQRTIVQIQDPCGNIIGFEAPF